MISVMGYDMRDIRVSDEVQIISQVSRTPYIVTDIEENYDGYENILVHLINTVTNRGRKAMPDELRRTFGGAEGDAERAFETLTALGYTEQILGS